MLKVLIIFFLVLNIAIGIEGREDRRKRSLIFPRGGSKVQFVVGTGVPVPLENHAITVGWVIKSAYLVAENASAITDSYITFAKRSVRRRATRYDFYRSFEHAAQSLGVGGKECMLRAICESSKTPFKASSIAGQIMHLFLTPSTTDEEPVTRSDMDYHNAERFGKEESAECRALYPSCLLSIIDILTMII